MHWNKSCPINESSLHQALQLQLHKGKKKFTQINSHQLQLHILQSKAQIDAAAPLNIKRAFKFFTLNENVSISLKSM